MTALPAPSVAQHISDVPVHSTTSHGPSPPPPPPPPPPPLLTPAAPPTEIRAAIPAMVPENVRILIVWYVAHHNMPFPEAARLFGCDPSSLYRFKAT